jgi:hypothetical protein
MELRLATFSHRTETVRRTDGAEERARRLVKPDIPWNSKEGITALLDWARAGGFVLDRRHYALAQKYGVPTEGGPFPLGCSEEVMVGFFIV